MKKHFLLQCQKNLIKEEQEIQIIRNDHRLTAQKQAKIKQNQPPPQTLCLALRRSNKGRSQHKEQCFTQQPATQSQKDNNRWMWNFTPRPGHRHAQSRKQLPLTETWEGIFLLFTLLQWLAGLVTPAHCHGIESHGNRTRPISDFSFPAFSNITPKGRVPGVVVRNARDKREC